MTTGHCTIKSRSFFTLASSLQCFWWFMSLEIILWARRIFFSLIFKLFVTKTALFGSKTRNSPWKWCLWSNNRRFLNIIVTRTNFLSCSYWLYIFHVFFKKLFSIFWFCVIWFLIGVSIKNIIRAWTNTSRSLRTRKWLSLNFWIENKTKTIFLTLALLFLRMRLNNILFIFSKLKSRVIILSLLTSLSNLLCLVIKITSQFCCFWSGNSSWRAFRNTYIDITELSSNLLLSWPRSTTLSILNPFAFAFKCIITRRVLRKNLRCHNKLVMWITINNILAINFLTSKLILPRPRRYRFSEYLSVRFCAKGD